MFRFHHAIFFGCCSANLCIPALPAWGALFAKGPCSIALALGSLLATRRSSWRADAKRICVTATALMQNGSGPPPLSSSP